MGKGTLSGAYTILVASQYDFYPGSPAAVYSANGGPDFQNRPPKQFVHGLSVAAWRALCLQCIGNPSMSTPTVQTRSRICADAYLVGAVAQPSHEAVPSILLLSQLFPPAIGGSAVLLEAVYSRQGTQVVVLTDGATAGPVPARAERITLVHRPLETTHWGLLDPKGLAHHVRVAWETRKLGSRGEVIVHCARALPEGVAAWLSRRLGGPLYVCWSHGEDLAMAQHSREFTIMTRRICLDAAANIANSHSTGRMLEALGVPPARIHVVHPGVDVARFRPEVDGSAIRARFAADPVTLLLSVGRLQRRKGHDLAIAAVARLGPSIPVKYLIVGDGEERRRLEALAVEVSVQDRVHFLGEVSASDLPSYYAACDIFMMPNRVDDGDLEGFGIVFLEAAATGRPVIGGLSGGVAEAVLNRETGLLVGGTDVDELAAAIRELALSADTRRAMGLAGRERACREFTWDRAAAQVRAVHARVAGAG